MSKRHGIFTENYTIAYSNAGKTRNMLGIQIWQILEDDHLEMTQM